MEEYKANEWGDLVCPHCRANIVTPVDDRGISATVSAGEMNCPLCKRVSKVTDETAQKVNRLTKSMDISTESLIETILSAVDEK